MRRAYEAWVRRFDDIAAAPRIPEPADVPAENLFYILQHGSLPAATTKDIPFHGFVCQRLSKPRFPVFSVGRGGYQHTAMLAMLSRWNPRSYEDLAPDGDMVAACIRCGLWREEMLLDDACMEMIVEAADSWNFSDDSVVAMINEFSRFRPPFCPVRMLEHLALDHPTIATRLPILRHLLTTQTQPVEPDEEPDGEALEERRRKLRVKHGVEVSDELTAKHLKFLNDALKDGDIEQFRVLAAIELLIWEALNLRQQTPEEMLTDREWTRRLARTIVLNGAAGTGKSWCTRAIDAILYLHRLRDPEHIGLYTSILTGSTANAAKGLGRRATTVHSAFRLHPENSALGRFFQYD
jgi:hypothetical protein